MYKHKWVVTPLGLQLSAIRFGEPEHTGSRIRIRTAGQCGFGFRALIVGLYYKFVVSTSVSGGTRPADFPRGIYITLYIVLLYVVLGHRSVVS